MIRVRSLLVFRLASAFAASLAAGAVAGCGDDAASPPGDAASDQTSQDVAVDQGTTDGTVDSTQADTAPVPTDAAEAGDAWDGGDAGPGLDGGDAGDAADAATLQSINHFIVIYMENHSFDNLYGEFPGADGVKGLDAAATTVAQLDGPDGAPYTTLPMPAALTGDGGAFADASLPNAPFPIESFIPADADTPVDLNHIFFTEQIQIDHGAMNLFAYQSNALGLSMGYYHSMNLPVPNEAKNFTVCDRFYHSAFGGSFLNHHFLIAAAAPVWDPNVKPLPQTDGGVTVFDDLSSIGPGQGEGYIWANASDPADSGGPTYYVVNTSYSVNSPHAPGGGKSLPQYLVPNQTNPTIGDRLTAANLDWAWYSGGWNDALAASADASVPEGGSTPAMDEFQYHHQPFVYYANYADGTPGRAHLKDEQDFVAAANAGALPAVSFVKPAGINNEHPNYTDLLTGENHLLSLIKLIEASPNWKDTAIIITYDEHGGFWDHVPPPAGDQWGPGERVPTIVISPLAKVGFVDHTAYDTSSILATIEKRWSLVPLTSRDRVAPPMVSAFRFSP
jgi:acid phosphatase